MHPSPDAPHRKYRLTVAVPASIHERMRLDAERLSLPGVSSVLVSHMNALQSKGAIRNRFSRARLDAADSALRGMARGSTPARLYLEIEHLVGEALRDEASRLYPKGRCQHIPARIVRCAMLDLYAPVKQVAEPVTDDVLRGALVGLMEAVYSCVSRETLNEKTHPLTVALDNARRVVSSGASVSGVSNPTVPNAGADQ